jgi:hypothetical protein
MSSREIPLTPPAALHQPSTHPGALPTQANLSTIAVNAPATQGRFRFLDLLKWTVSFPAMLGTFLIGRVFYEGRSFTVDPDIWWHIQVGQDILSTHRFPTTDPYSFTVHGTPWIAYEWLGELILGFVARFGGVLALDAVLITLAGIIMLALYFLATQRSGNCKAACIVSMTICSVAFISFTMRPQMFGYLYMILVMIALGGFRKGNSWPIWFLPLIFLLWVNTHGTFILGIGVLVLYLLAGLRNFQVGSIEASAWSASQRLQLEIVLLLCLAVLPLTPYGTQVAVSPFDMAFNQPLNLSTINEWQPMPFDLIGGKMFLAFVVIFIALQMFFRFIWRLEEFVLVLAGGVMACLHVRFVMLFVVFFTPLLATMLARWVPPYKRALEQYFVNTALMVIFILTMIYYRPTREFLQERVADAYPVAAVQYLDQHPVTGRMWNSYGFGGYLISSGREVFIDGRGDIYERGGILSDYTLLSELKPGSLSILDRYGIQSCLVKPKESLTAALLISPNWKRVYEDNMSVLFVRSSPTASQSGSIPSP